MKIPVSIAVLISILSAMSCSQNEIANIPDNNAFINVSSDSGIVDYYSQVCFAAQLLGITHWAVWGISNNS